MAKQTTETPEKELPEQEQRAIAVSSGGAATLHTWRNIRLIIGREYKNQVTQRIFIIMSIILLAIVFLATFIPTIAQFFSSRSSAQTSIVVVNDAGSVAGLNDTELSAYIGTALNGTTGTQTAGTPAFALTFSTTNALPDLQNQLKNGKLDILLVLARATNQDMRFTYDTSASATNDTNLPTIQGLTQLLAFLDTAHRLGLTSQETQRLSAAPDVTVVYTQQSQNTRPDSEITAEILLAVAGCILIFISINVYAGRVAVGVAEEKSSRVMELLLNAATPLQLMVGKIVGIGAAGLTQMAGLVAVGIGALLLQFPIQAALFGTSAGGLSQYLISVSVPFYLLFLVYFLLGFFLYATIYAGLGSMVKRQDEVQSAIMLPILLLTSGYVLIFLAVQSPDATWVRVLSFIPFWTPTLMLVRIAAGTVYWWDIALSIVLMLVTICACAWFSARIYRFGVLMYGQKPSFGQLLKLARMN